MIIVQFENVGRAKMGWLAQMKELNDDTLYHEVKSKGALMSREVEFEFDRATQHGTIFAGFRPVGQYFVVASVQASPAPAAN